jgi:hypothetical protein
MLITDLIRDANSEHEVHFWTTAYIESVRYGDQLGLLPERVTRLPLTGARDIRERFDGLVIELDAASRQLNDRFCTAIKEALQVFGAGIARLKLIDNAHRESLAQAMRSLSEKHSLAAYKAQTQPSGAMSSHLHS